MANEVVKAIVSTEKMLSRQSGRKIPVRSLLNLCVEATVSSIDKLMPIAISLPSMLKAKILHLMSKRSLLITDSSLSKLATEWTEELDFTNSFISDAGLLQLPTLSYLYKLDLNDTKTGKRENVTSKSVEHIARSCPNLVIVYLRRCVNICDKGVIALASFCKRLGELNLSGCTQITDKSLQAIADNSCNLTNLNLAYTAITDQGALYLAKGLSAGNLQEVQVSHCKALTDEGVEALLQGLVKVTYLEIQGCPKITDQSIEALDHLREKYNLKQFNYTIPL